MARDDQDPRKVDSPSHMSPGDQAPPTSENAGEMPCRECKGSGRIADRRCPVCEGSGYVMEGIGGA